MATKTATKTPAKVKATPKAAKPAKATPASNGASSKTRATLPPTERRVTLVKLLQKRKAFDPTSAVPIDALAEQLGYTRFDVYALVSGGTGKAGSAPTCLMATGYADIAKVEGTKGLSVYLTKLGQKADFTQPPFARKTKAAE